MTGEHEPEQPLISAVIPTFNDGMFLEDCITSIEAQTLPVTEIIVVDDGSTDEDARRAIELACRHRSSVVPVRQENAGPAAARNLGLARAKGEYLVFVDVDDQLAADCLAERFALLQGNPKLAGTYSGYVSPLPSGARYSSFRSTTTQSLVAAELGRPDGVPGGLPLYLFRTDALREIGGLDASLSMMEDFDLLLRLARAGWQFAGTNQPGYIRIRRDDSHTRSSASDRLRATLEFLHKARKEKYFPFTELLRRYAAILGQYLWRHVGR